MKREKPGLLGALLLVLLAGCASSGPKYAELRSNLPSLEPGQGRIFFYRDSSALGAAIQPDIKLNDAVIGSSTPGGFFFVDRPAGSYTASVATEVENTIPFTVAPSQTRYIKSLVGFGIVVGRVHFQLVDAEQALSELAELHYVGDALRITPEPRRADAATHSNASTKRVELDDLKDLLPARSP